jgi:hypothetical protein
VALDFGALTAPCNDVFGGLVTYTPTEGASFDVNGVYDDAYTEVHAAGDGTSVTSTSPILGVQLADFPCLPLQGDTLVVKKTGERFIVKEVRPDSHGWAILMLNLRTAR